MVTWLRQVWTAWLRQAPRPNRRLRSQDLFGRYENKRTMRFLCIQFYQVNKLPLSSRDLLFRRELKNKQPEHRVLKKTQATTRQVLGLANSQALSGGGISPPGIGFSVSSEHPQAPARGARQNCREGTAVGEHGRRAGAYSCAVRSSWGVKYRSAQCFQIAGG